MLARRFTILNASKETLDNNIRGLTQWSWVSGTPVTYEQYSLIEQNYTAYFEIYSNKRLQNDEWDVIGDPDQLNGP